MKIRQRGIFAVGALLAAGSLVLSACGGAQPGQSGEATGSNGNGEASAWALTGGTHEIIWRDSFDKWNTENSDQSINVDWFANDAYKEKIRTAIGSDNAPTLVFGWGGATLRDYVEAGKVVDITDNVKDSVDKLIPSIADGGIVDGKYYALPNVGTQPVHMYYNKQLFEEQGLEIPQTWDDLLNCVEKFKEAGIIPISLAGASKWTSMMWLEYLFDRIGGSEVFDRIANGEKDAWSDPAAIEALGKAQELVKAGAFGDAYGSVVADANADVALVHTGKAAMMLHGSWAYGTFMTDAPDFVKEGNLAFGAFPSIEGGKGDPSAVAGNQSNFWSVSAASSEQAQTAAKGYLNNLFDDEYVKAMVDGGDIPPTVGAEKFIKGSEQEDYLTFGYDIVLNSSNFQLSWDQELPSDTSQTLLDNIQLLFDLSITPEQFADAMNATIK